MGATFQATFDCADPAALAGSWAAVLLHEQPAPPDGFPTRDEALESWGVPPERRPAGERDAALDAERGRLEALGARPVARLEGNGTDLTFLVVQDPEGNEFRLD